MDEINQMSLEEYYRLCFPEIWETLSHEEIEEYKTINYEEFHSESKPSERKPIVDVFVSYATGSSPGTRKFTGRIGMTGNGSKKAYSMDTTYVLYDTTGETWGGGSGGNKNCT